MPRLYKPKVVLSNEYGDYDFFNTEATMEESRYGEWVRLSTYKDEVARLNSQINKFKKQLTKFNNENNLVKP